MATVILGSIISAGGYLIAHLLFDSKIGLRQKAIDNWGRIDYLLETDIREAVQASAGSLTGATGSCTSISGAVITVATTSSAGSIVYYNGLEGGKEAIRRCGPNILENGSLSSSGISDNALALDTRISSRSGGGTLIEYDVEFVSIGIRETGYARPRARAY